MNRRLFFGGWLALLLWLLIEPARVEAAESSPKTGSATPEVAIKGKSAKQIRAAVSKFFIGRGYAEKEGPNGELTYQKARNNPEGSSGPQQCLRIKVRIGKLEKSIIKVMSRSFGVDDCGTEKEKEIPTPGGYPQVQGFLEEIKVSLGSK